MAKRLRLQPKVQRNVCRPGMADGRAGFVFSWPSGRSSGFGAGRNPIGAIVKLMRRHLKNIPKAEYAETRITLWATVRKTGGGVKRSILASGTGVDEIEKIVGRARKVWKGLPKERDHIRLRGETYDL